MIPDFKTYLNESVWGDIRKKSIGQEERLEDGTNIRFMKPVDLGGSILWADRDLEQQGKDVFTYKEVEKLLSRTEWRLPTSEEAKELFCPGKYEENGYSFSNGNQKLLFKKRRYEYQSGESYIGWTSTVMGTMLSKKYNRMGVFVMEDGNTSQDDFILTCDETSHYSARLVKDLPNTNESVWGNIRKKSLGQEERLEDNIDVLFDLIEKTHTTQSRQSPLEKDNDSIYIPLFYDGWSKVRKMRIAYIEGEKHIYIDSWTGKKEGVKNAVEAKYNMKDVILDDKRPSTTSCEISMKNGGKLHNEDCLDIIDTVVENIPSDIYSIMIKRNEEVK